MTHTYTPGAGYVVAAADFLVFLPDGAKPQVLRELWTSCTQALGKGFLGVLSAVTSSLDPTLENLPRFAIVELGKPSGAAREARIAVSGSTSVHLRLAHSDTPVVFHGEGVAMWLEERVWDAVAFEIGRAGESATFDDASVLTVLESEEEAEDELTDSSGELDLALSVNRSLPLGEGIVMADRVWWEFAQEDSAVESTPVRATSSGAAQSYGGVADSLDELGRTLAEIPEAWFEDGLSSSGDALFESASEGSSDGGFVPTQVIPGGQADVMPTEIVQAIPAEEPPAPGRFAASSAFALSAGYVRFSHGELVELGVPIVVGRKPTHEGAGAPAHARMISVPSPSKDISRNHLEIRVEHGHVLVTDLNSVNGTVLRRQGQPDRTLVGKEAVLVLNDDVVDLGDGVTLVFEQLR